jgi:DNA-binding MarR family transcriptional regulator
MVYRTEEELIVDDINRLAPIVGKKSTTKIRAAYLLGDELTKQRIQETIDAIKAAIFSEERFSDIPVMEPPSEHAALKGNIELGTVLYDKQGLYPLMLSEEDFLTHIGIFGSSGSGKTNLARSLTKKLSEKDIPILIFDFSKRNYRNLLKDPELKDKVNIYTVGRNTSPFRFNPLKPPEGIPVSQWAKEFAEIFDHAYWLLGGGRHVILKALDKVYEETVSSGYPKIQDLKKGVNHALNTTKTSREKNWIATAQRPLESLTFREVGHIFDTEEGITPDKFFEKGKITILELDPLATSDKTFIIEIMLQWIRDWLLVSDKRNELNGVIVIEEAHNILNREKTIRSGMEGVIDLIFREVRELGIGLVYLDQHPSLISYPALGNTSTHIYMNLGLDTKSSSDIMDASHMLGLKTNEEIEHLRKLPTGNGYIVARRMDYKNPFLIKFPLLKIDNSVLKDEDIREIMGKRLIKVYKEKKKNEDEVNIPKDPENAIEMIYKKEDIDSIARSLDRSLWSVLKVLASGRGISSSQIQRRLGVSGTTFRKRAEDLVDKDLINRKKVKLYRNYAYFYFLTRKGKLVYISKYGEIVNRENEESVEDLKEKVKEDYISRGWQLIEEDEDLVFGKRDLRNRIIFKTSVQGYDDVDEHLERVDGDLVFVCSSKPVKRKVIQSLAKYSYETEMNFMVYVLAPEEIGENIDSCSVEFVDE